MLKKITLISFSLILALIISGCGIAKKNLSGLKDTEKTWTLNQLTLKDEYRAGTHNYSGTFTAPNDCFDLEQTIKTTAANRTVVLADFNTVSKNGTCLGNQPTVKKVEFKAEANAGAKVIATFNGQPLSVVLEAEPAAIVVTDPEIASVISGPYKINGRAKGSWFFEGSFPIVLIDSTGTQIAQTIGEAVGEWMTENYVPFTATIDVPDDAEGAGQLLLKKNNPSGEAELDDFIAIPVTFANKKVTWNEPFYLTQNQVRTLDDNTLKLISISNDSRCPLRNNCTQIGNVTVNISDIQATKAQTKTLTLILPEKNKVKLTSGATLELLDVMPKPGETNLGRQNRVLVKLSRD